MLFPSAGACVFHPSLAWKRLQPKGNELSIKLRERRQVISNIALPLPKAIFGARHHTQGSEELLNPKSGKFVLNKP